MHGRMIDAEDVGDITLSQSVRDVPATASRLLDLEAHVTAKPLLDPSPASGQARRDRCGHVESVSSRRRDLPESVGVCLG
jgi:hypothetical protein